MGNSLPMMSPLRLLSVVGGRGYYDRFGESGRHAANDVVIKVTVRCLRSRLLCYLGEWKHVANDVVIKVTVRCRSSQLLY